MTIDPVVSMAISIESRKGVYALLLGSGVSRAAGLPTGWEIVLDLIRRVSELHGDGTPADPEAWYRDRFKKAPNYSDVLGALALTQADRSQLLRTYFEPTEEERDQGLKLPTAAHRAIARLAAQGYVKVILTTNFDRLIELALAEAGVTPNIVWSTSSLAGMTPLQHADCTVVKLHGDYAELDTRNTPEELSQYDASMESLLDRIFTEYGLVICGWSAEWDHALREALIRTTRHRFTTYWLARSPLTEPAQRAAAVRNAVVIEGISADVVFSRLESTLDAIRDSRTSHPRSRDIAVASAKRYLSEPRFLIRLEELVSTEATLVHDIVAGPDFDLGAPTPDASTVRARAERADAVSAAIGSVLMVGCYWGSDAHRPIWARALRRIASYEERAGSVYDVWRAMRLLPAAFALYAAGIGALAADNYDTLKFLLFDCTRTRSRAEIPLIKGVNGREAFDHNATALLYPPTGKKTPGSDWLFERLSVYMDFFVGGHERFQVLFHRFELLLSMAYCDLVQNQVIETSYREWMPDGRYIWHGAQPLYTPSVFRSEVEKQKKDWRPLRAGMFGGDPLRATQLLDAVESTWRASRF